MSNCTLAYLPTPTQIEWHPKSCTAYAVDNDSVIPLLSRSLFPLVSSGARTKYFPAERAPAAVKGLWQFLRTGQPHGAAPALSHPPLSKDTNPSWR